MDEAEGRALRVIREARIGYILAHGGEAEHSRTADDSHGQKPSSTRGQGLTFCKVGDL